MFLLICHHVKYKFGHIKTIYDKTLGVWRDTSHEKSHETRHEIGFTRMSSILKSTLWNFTYILIKLYAAINNM